MSLARYYAKYTAKRPAKGSFGAGTEVNLGTLKGFLQPVSGGENFDHYKGDEKITHRLYAPKVTNLIYGDVIKYNSIEYVVIYSVQPNGISGMSKHKEILVSRRGQGV